MKNVNMTINSNAVQSLAPPPPAPAYPAPAMSSLQKIYSVSFSVQFNVEAEALEFASNLLKYVRGDNN